MRNSNKLMYTATYKAVLMHADLQLARKPRVAAHTPQRNPKQADLQLAKKPRVAAHTARPKQPDLQLAKKPRVAAHTAKPRQPDQQLAMKPRVAAHTRAGRSCKFKHTISIKHSSYRVPPGSPTGSYSCKHFH